MLELKNKDKKVVKKPELTKQEIQNLINLVSTHPTMQGVGSQEGQLKLGLINKLSEIMGGKAISKFVV